MLGFYGLGIHMKSCRESPIKSSTGLCLHIPQIRARHLLSCKLWLLRLLDVPLQWLTFNFF